jgi:hypothetical protein
MIDCGKCLDDCFCWQEFWAIAKELEAIITQNIKQFITLFEQYRYIELNQSEIIIYQ